MKRVVYFFCALSFSVCHLSADTATIHQLIRRSFNHVNENSPDSGLILAEEALRLAVLENEPGSQAKAYYQIGKSLIQNEEYTRAMQSILSADSIFRIIKDSGGIAQTNLQLGLIEYTQHNYQDAIPYFEITSRIAGSIGKNGMKETANYLKALSYIETGRLNEADVILNETAISKLKQGNFKNYNEILHGLAKINLRKGNFQKAIEQYGQSLNYFVENDNPDGISMSHYGIAETFNKMGLKDSALYHYRYSYEVSKKSEFQEGVMQTSFALASLYKNRKEYDKAFYFLEEYKSIHDTIFNIDNARKLAKQRYQMNLEQKQLEINLANKQKAKQKLLMFLAFTTSFLLIIITIILFRNYRFKQKANRELEDALKELKNAQQQLIHNAKLASLGQLTAGVAHELKNPLNFIINFSNYSSESLSEYIQNGSENHNQIFEELRVNLDKIQSHGNRANSIITNMMMHARHTSEEKSWFNLSLLLGETIDLAYQGMRASNPAFYSRFSIRIMHEKMMVFLNKQEIARCILNILNNSFYAIRSKKRSDPSYEPEIKIYLGHSDKNAKIVIEDNATGISKEIIEQVFDPFFTTKPPGDGTGLGLSMTYDMIKSNGGTITVESEKMKFARFVILLPIL